jgi:hypothetical protein
MSSVRKERREDVDKFLARRINSGQRRCDSARRRNLHQASGGIRENDHTIRFHEPPTTVSTLIIARPGSSM